MNWRPARLGAQAARLLIGEGIFGFRQRTELSSKCMSVSRRAGGAMQAGRLRSQPFAFLLQRQVVARSSKRSVQLQSA